MKSRSIKFSGIKNIDELIRYHTSAYNKDEDAWSLFEENMEIDYSKSEGELRSSYEPPTMDYPGGMYIEDYYFIMYFETSISLKSLAVALDELDVVDADFAYTAMTKDTKTIIPTVYKFLVDYLKNGDMDDIFYRYIPDIISNINGVTEAIEFLNLMDETLHVYAYVTVNGEHITIKLTVTSYDDSKNQSVPSLASMY